MWFNICRRLKASIHSVHCLYFNLFCARKARKNLACVAGVQRGGRGEVECEREARSLGSRRDLVGFLGSSGGRKKRRKQ